MKYQLITSYRSETGSSITLEKRTDGLYRATCECLSWVNNFQEWKTIRHYTRDEAKAEAWAREIGLVGQPMPDAPYPFRTAWEAIIEEPGFQGYAR